MTAAHPYGFSDDDLAAIAREIWDTYAANIPRYSSLGDAGLRQQVIESSIAVVEVYLRAFFTKTLPSREILRQFTEVERERMLRGFQPEELERAAIIQSEVIWNHISERAEPQELPALASLTLRLVDALSGSRNDARQQLLSARSAGIRSYVSQLLLDEIVTGGSENGIAEEAGKFLGYDVASPNRAVVLAPSRVAGARLSTAEVRSFHRALDTLPEEAVVVGAATPSSYRLLVGGTEARHTESAVAHIVAHTHGLAEGARAGVGSALPGLSGTKRSLEEAKRAWRIGLLLDPARTISYYEETRALDVFAGDDALDAFTFAVLQPLLDFDAENDASLIETIQVMFESGWRRKQAAAGLHVHPNTIDYRIRQAESLLGVPLEFGRPTLKVFLALQLLATRNRL